jgi:hypothetical protein
MAASSRVAEQIQDADDAVRVTQRLLDVSFRYIDRVSGRVIDAHQEQRDRWLQTQTAARAGRVRALLAGKDVDAGTTEASLGYRLGRPHLGLVSWIPDQTQDGDGLARLDRLTSALAEGLGCRGRPLFVPCDQTVAWSWLPLETPTAIVGAVVRKIVEEHDDTARVAAGEVAAGIAGFRQTHQQALRAQDVAVFARPARRVTLFTDVGPVALMLADVEATRGWVWHVLGRLCEDDEHASMLRQTLRVFLGAGGSYTATASCTCTATRSNTGCAKRKKPWGGRSTGTSRTSSWRFGSVIPSARRSSSRPHDPTGGVAHPADRCRPRQQQLLPGPAPSGSARDHVCGPLRVLPGEDGIQNGELGLIERGVGRIDRVGGVVLGVFGIGLGSVGRVPRLAGFVPIAHL